MSRWDPICPSCPLASGTYLQRCATRSLPNVPTQQGSSGPAPSQACALTFEMPLVLCPSPPLTQIFIMGENEIYWRTNLFRSFLVHKLLGPRPPPPQHPLQAQACTLPLQLSCHTPDATLLTDNPSPSQRVPDDLPDRPFAGVERGCTLRLHALHTRVVAHPREPCRRVAQRTPPLCA